MADLFALLKQIDSCEIDHYKNLSDEEKKEIYLFLVQRWMTGTSDAKQILFIDHFVNSKIWSLSKDQDLVYKLLCASSTGVKRYKWIPKKKKDSKSEVLKLVANYYDCSKKEAVDYLCLHDQEDILEMAAELGVDKDILTKIKKELK